VSAQPGDNRSVTDETRLTALVSGRVQGVGFRDFVRRRAADLGLRGRASNLPDGRVEVVAEGTPDAAQQLLTTLRDGRTPGSVERVDAAWSNAEGLAAGFTGE
jgi:acylphosphatase